MCNTCPYRKPTQVDEERILRPAGEALLRNSAKWLRNFGIRSAHESGPQRIGPFNIPLTAKKERSFKMS